jgi:hypothetical protein
MTSGIKIIAKKGLISVKSAKKLFISKKLGKKNKNTYIRNKSEGTINEAKKFVKRIKRYQKY